MSCPQVTAASCPAPFPDVSDRAAVVRDICFIQRLPFLVLTALKSVVLALILYFRDQEGLLFQKVDNY